jgi:hypothetical protein
MKKIILTAVLAIAGSASADTNINMQVTCVNGQTLLAVTSEFNEEPALAMNSLRETRNGMVNNRTVLFINYETKTWTLAERISSDRFCIIAVGEEIAPRLKNDSK